VWGKETGPALNPLKGSSACLPPTLPSYARRKPLLSHAISVCYKFAQGKNLHPSVNSPRAASRHELLPPRAPRLARAASFVAQGDSPYSDRNTSAVDSRKARRTGKAVASAATADMINTVPA